MMIIGAVAGVLVIPYFFGAYSLAYRWLFAEPTGAVQEREITTRGAYRIEAYEKFYRIQEDIGSLDTRLAAMPAAADLDPRQQIECRGILAVRATRVREYNEASRAVRTQGQWRAPDLPSTLEQRNPRKC